MHVVGVARAENLRTVARLRRELTRSRHDVALHFAPPAAGAGKWANVNAALAAAPLGDADWLLIVDDDVILPRGFLDRFLALAEGFGFELAQPAHAFASHAAWDITRRRPGVLARRTRFVEIGPVTALSARAARELLPFPDLQMGWGLDARWSAIAAEHELADRRDRRHPRPPLEARRGLLPARRRDRGGRGLPGRPRLRDPHAGRRDGGGVPPRMRVVIVAEYYPRVADPALGVWAHRQALAARDAGADVEVVVLHRPVPSKAALKSRDLGQLVAPLKQPLRTTLDGIRVTYAPFVAPPRPRSYPSWGAWAAPSLALALETEPFDLVHAHYAAPAGDAVRRLGKPMVVSVHGGDVLGVATKWANGRAVVERSLRAAKLVLANSEGIAARCRALGAQDVRVVHLGTDVPAHTTTRRPTSSPSATSSPASATPTSSARCRPAPATS